MIPEQQAGRFPCAAAQGVADECGSGQQPLLRGLVLGLLFVSPFWALAGRLVWGALG